MSSTLQARKINFKFGDYISQAINLMQKDFGTIFLSFLCVMILSIIPFLNLMAVGNFYKVCYKIDKDIPTGAGEIFNFDNFMPYFIFQLYIILAVIVLMVPVGIFIPFLSNTENSIIPIIFVAIFVAIYILILYFSLQAFYIPAFISLKKMTNLKDAWTLSKAMTRGNLLMILLFSIAVGFLAELGIILCVIGIILTIPFAYVAHYFAFKDALSQIEQPIVNE